MGTESAEDPELVNREGARVGVGSEERAQPPPQKNFQNFEQK